MNCNLTLCINNHFRYPTKKPTDNLVMEGEFTKRVVEESYFVGEKYPMKKPVDNLRPEGSFPNRVRPEAPVGERAAVVRHPDNIKLEGSFPDRIREAAPAIERTRPIMHEDNLKPSEVPFTTRNVEEAPKGERAQVKIPQGNLKQEGEHYYPQKEGPKTGERFPMKKPKDNLVPEGKFTDRVRDDGPKVGER